MRALPYIGLTVVTLILIFTVVLGGGGALLSNVEGAPVASHSWHRIDPPEDSEFSACWLLMANLEPAGVTCQ